jgi:cell division protein FtsI (penicillin-binding protein 3)
MREAFEVSSNIAISRKIQDYFGHNPQRFIDYLKEIGLGSPLGFQITGEGSPKIKDPKDKSWSGITLPWMSIGYEVELTPLQVLAFYNAIANNGMLIRPILVKSVKRADRNIENYQADIMKRRICSRSTLTQIQELLEAVVERGTAQNIKNDNYKIAGKTGTAQRIKDGRYSRSYYTSFVGYFPAEQPKYSCIVIIDDPKGFRQYGSNVAAPVFKEIADKIYSLDLRMHAPWRVSVPDDQGLPVIRAGYRDDLDLICKNLKIPVEERPTDPWVVTQAKNQYVSYENNDIIPGIVPNVSGMSLRDALFILENHGLRVNYRGNGRVVEQSQKPGSKALKGSTIYITLS